MTDIPALIARVRELGSATIDEHSEEFVALEAAMAENARLREALREIAGYDLRAEHSDSVAHEIRDEARAALEGTK